MGGISNEMQRDIDIAQARRRREQATHAAQEIDSSGPSFFQQGLSITPEGTTEAVVNSLARNAGEPFNRGVASMLDLPVTLTNMSMIGLDAADKKLREIVDLPFNPDRPIPQMRMPFTELGEKAGLIAPEGERADGFVAKAFEFTGAGAIPFAASLQLGKKALETLSVVPSILQNIGRATAANPVKATAFDIASNVSASGGGTAARKLFPDNDTIVAMAELGFAFLPTAATLIPSLASKWTLAGRAWDKAKELSAPWSDEGSMYVAASELQDRAADPRALAMKFNEDGTLASPDPRNPVESLVDLPIALRTGDPDLIKLQNLILSRRPALQRKYSEELNAAIKALSAHGGFPGGDVERATHLLNVRQQMAVENANLRFSQLKPGASPRQISSIFREEIELALTDASRIETRLWESLDSGLPGELTNARKTYDDLLAKYSKEAREPLIPEWLSEKLVPEVDSRLMRQLDNQGWVGADGEISPALKSVLDADPKITRQLTFNDLKQIRSDVLKEMKFERGQVAPDQNRIRALNEIQSSLLDDLKATGVDDILDANGKPMESFKKARDYSRSINERYRQGRPGRLLGYDVTGAERVEGQDLLNDVWKGQHRATNSQKLSEMIAEGPQQVMEFFKAKYVQAVYDWSYSQGGFDVGASGKLNPAAHKAFVNNLRDSDIFEVFPELELELRRMYEAGADALALDVSDTAVKSMQSRASLLLRASVEDQMALILNSENPVATTREIMSRLHAAEMSISPNGKRLIWEPDKMARQGLKTSFMREVLRSSGGTAIDADGVVVPNGRKAKALLKDYDDVMEAMQFTPLEKKRAQLVVDEIALAQGTAEGAGDIGGSIIQRGAPKLMTRLAQVIGAQIGGKVGRAMGGGTIQTPGFFSAEARYRIESLTSSKAEELVIEALFGGADGRGNVPLFRALMIGPRASQDAQRKAEKALMDALDRLGSQARVTTAVGAATIPDTMPELQEAQ